jgi:hypothetical protein
MKIIRKQATMKKTDAITAGELRANLWDKGFRNYNDSINRMAKVLKKYDTVASLPADITLQDLQKISTVLALLSTRIDSAADEMDL